MDDSSAVEPSAPAWAWVADRTVTEAITCAVADTEGISSMRVDPPLDDVVDTDLLDPALDGSGSTGPRLVFTYRGHEVTIDADGFLTVSPGGERDLA